MGRGDENKRLLREMMRAKIKNVKKEIKRAGDNVEKNRKKLLEEFFFVRNRIFSLFVLFDQHYRL